MFIELIELFRCTRDHRESWLVAIIDEADGRVVLRGALGCPECGSEYPITDGVLDMRPPGAATPAGIAVDADPWRIAALLDLRPASTTVVLEGAAAGARDAILEIFTGNVIAVNPPRELAPRERSAVVLAAGTLPLRTASTAAVALRAADSRLVIDSVRVLRQGGRLLAPNAADVPAGLRVLARDDHEWVAQVEAATAPLQLTRR